MDAKLGHETDALSFLAALAREPYRYDFYQTMRRLECLYPDKPRWGDGAVVRSTSRSGWGRTPTWPSRRLRSRRSSSAATARRRGCRCRLFGLLGPNGPLPVHITEYVRHRLRHAGGSHAQSVPGSVSPSISGAVLPRLGAGAAARQSGSGGPGSHT